MCLPTKQRSLLSCIGNLVTQADPVAELVFLLDGKGLDASHAYTLVDMSDLIRLIQPAANPQVILDAPHAEPPRNDPQTGQIVEAAANLAGCCGIISRQSRVMGDINRHRTDLNAGIVDAHRAGLRSLIGHQDRPCAILHIAVHGMRDRGWHLEIGTAPDPMTGREACSKHVRELVATTLRESGLCLPSEVWVNRAFVGDPSLLCHRHGDPDPRANYPGYGHRWNSVQLEISASLRREKAPEVILALAKLAQIFRGLLS